MRKPLLTTLSMTLLLLILAACSADEPAAESVAEPTEETVVETVEETAEESSEEASTASATGFSPEECFVAAPNNDGSVVLDSRDGPYTIGLSNSFVGNAWRTQMIQMAEAFAAQPGIAEQIEE
ncbi:MAG: hypothetical protein AAF633_00155, partial [Chloroflexota bacterium]